MNVGSVITNNFTNPLPSSDESIRAQNAFATAFPDIQLDVSFTDRIVNLIDEGFDVAVRVGNPSDTSLIARKLCDMRVVTAASPAYLLRKGEPLAPAQLADHDCIIDTNFRDPLIWRSDRQ